MLTPVFCVGGCCGGCCLECCRSQTKSVGGLYKAELIFSSTMLLIGVLLFIFISISYGRFLFADECWSTATNKHFHEGFLCAICLGFGTPAFLQFILRIYVAPPSSVDYAEQNEELVDEENEEHEESEA